MIRWFAVIAALAGCAEQGIRGTQITVSELEPGTPVSAITERVRRQPLSGDWGPLSEAIGSPAPRDPSPPPGSQFEGLPQAGSIWPPDTMGAVGPNHLMITLNSEVRIQTKAGLTLSTVSLATFWAPSGASNPFDPAVAFHPGLSRWLTIAVSNRRSAGASLLIGISQTADPTGAWNLFRVDGDSGDTTWPDYPRLGFNGQWAVVAANMFGNATGAPFVQSKVWAFPLADLQNNLATPTVMTSPFTTLVPAQTFDPSSDVVLVATANTPGGLGLALPRVSGPVASPTLTTSGASVRLTSPLPFAFDVVPAPQQGTSTRIDGVTFNDSETQTAVVRNGRLYVAHQIGLPVPTATRTSIQWWEIELSTNTIVAVGRIDDPTGARMASHPGIAVNAAGDVILGYTRFSTTTFPSAAFAVHLANDLPGTLRDEVIYRAGEAAHTQGLPGTVRWGDYSASAVDPVDGCTLWTIQQFAAAGNRWSTWWARVPMPDQPLTVRLPTLPTVAEDTGPSSALVEVLSRVVGCARPMSALSVSASSLTPTLIGVDAGVVVAQRAPVSWSLAPDENGPATLRIALSDGTATTSADVSFQVTEVNDAPTASPDAVTVDEDTVGVIAVLANDRPGPTNESLQRLVVVGLPARSDAGAILSLDGGLVLLTPPPDFNGVDRFSYGIQDDGTTNGVAAPLGANTIVSVTVRPVNDPPQVMGVMRATPEDTALAIPAAMAFTGTPGPPDELAQVLSITRVDSLSDAGGLVALDGGTIVYQPPADFSGADRFSVVVSDDGVPNAASAAVVQVTVTPVNDPPTVVADDVTVPEDTAVTIPAAQLLQNDTPGPFESTQRLRLIAVQLPADAGLVNATLEDGGLVLRPLADAFGSTEGTSEVEDDGVPAARSTGRLRVTVTPVNDPPFAQEDLVMASARLPLELTAAMVLANDRPGPENERPQRLSVRSVAGASQQGGQVTFAGDVITYRARPGFSGADSFTYEIEDDGITGITPDPLRASGVVRVTVTDTNEAPEAQPDQVVAREDTELTFMALLANDRPGPAFENGQRIDLVSVATRTERGGALSLTDGGVRYAPPADFSGVDRFTYRIRDDGLTNGIADPKEAEGSVTITVTEVNDEPVAGADSVQVEEGGTSLLPLSELFANDRPGPAAESAQRLTVVEVGAGARLEGAGLVFDGTQPLVEYVIEDDGTTDGRLDPKRARGGVTVTVVPGPAPVRPCGCSAAGGLWLGVGLLAWSRRRSARRGA